MTSGKKILGLLWVNLLWLVCCIPVITAGASTCAAFAVTLRLADDDDEVASVRGIIQRFFKAFRQDLFQGFLISVFTLVCAGLGGLFIYLALDYGLNLIIIGLLAVYFFVVIVFNFYSYPLIARYSNTFINTLRNSIALFAQYAKPSLKTLGIVIIETAVLALTFKVYFAGVLILPSVIFYTISRTAKDIFFNLENPQPVDE